MTLLDAYGVFDLTNGALAGAESEDLDFTLVEWEAGRGVAEHTNDEVDVLMILFRGEATLTIDDQATTLQQGAIALIPKGTRRQITAGPEGVRYLNVHRRRKRLMPGSLESRPR